MTTEERLDRVEKAVVAVVQLLAQTYPRVPEREFDPVLGDARTVLDDFCASLKP